MKWKSMRMKSTRKKSIQMKSTLKVEISRVLDFVIFEIFDHFRKILYPWKVSKPQNRKIKYLPRLRFSFS